MDSEAVLLKFLIVGPEKVGKTSFVQHEPTDNYVPTIGVDFKVLNISIDNRKYKIQLWDTAGQARFQSITRSYFKGANGIIFMYDISERKSFEELKNRFYDVQKELNEHVKGVLVGNKRDLFREVSQDEGS
jgi:small GTP-binding protein